MRVCGMTACGVGRRSLRALPLAQDSKRKPLLFARGEKTRHGLFDEFPGQTPPGKSLAQSPRAETADPGGILRPRRGGATVVEITELQQPDARFGNRVGVVSSAPQTHGEFAGGQSTGGQESQSRRKCGPPGVAHRHCLRSKRSIEKPPVLSEESRVCRGTGGELPPGPGWGFLPPNDSFVMSSVDWIPRTLRAKSSGFVA